MDVDDTHHPDVMNPLSKGYIAHVNICGNTSLYKHPDHVPNIAKYQ